MDLISPIISIVNTIISRIFPDKAQQDQARLELTKLQQSGDLDQIKVQMSAIIAEAQSTDKWTSRARPSFLYVMYLMILAAIPMGFVSAVDLPLAQAVSSGLKEWLSAIPTPMWDLFGAGYLGYSFSRSWDKTQILKSKT